MRSTAFTFDLQTDTVQPITLPVGATLLTDGKGLFMSMYNTTFLQFYTFDETVVDTEVRYFRLFDPLYLANIAWKETPPNYDIDTDAMIIGAIQNTGGDAFIFCEVPAPPTPV